MISQVHAADATPEIAAIYADISAVSGVPMVNLIWRHFASLPGVLEWAWAAVRPLVGSIEMASARVRLEAAVDLPALTPRASAEWRQAGVAETELANFHAMMAAYVRGNLTNIIALTALRLRLDRPNDPPAQLSPAPIPPLTPPLPLLLRIETLPADLAATVRALAGSHDGTRDGTIPSLYLAVAPWPGVVAALSEWLRPLYAPEAMRAARQSVVRAAEAEAAALLPTIRPAPQALPVIRPTLDRFTTLVIPDLIPVCIALRGLLPGH